jgi:hypothetical protein
MSENDDGRYYYVDLGFLCFCLLVLVCSEIYCSHFSLFHVFRIMSVFVFFTSVTDSP